MSGNEEFQTSGIDIDKQAGQAVSQLENEIYGMNDICNDFRDRLEIKNSEGEVVGGLLLEEQEKNKRDNALLRSLFSLNQTEEEFIDDVLYRIQKPNSYLGKRLLYLQHTPEDIQKDCIRRIWQKTDKAS